MSEKRTPEDTRRKRLVKNSARCRKCDHTITSTFRHHFASCKCGAIFVDGGLDYQRYGGNPEDFEDLSEWEDDPAEV